MWDSIALILNEPATLMPVLCTCNCNLDVVCFNGL